MKRKRKVEAKGQYWGDEQDKAVHDYNTETDQRIRSQLFDAHLYEHLHAMASAILLRYYKRDDKELILDSISHVVEKAISKYDTEHGRTFSFFQTVIKNYFYDALNPRKSKYKFIPIDDLSFEHGDNGSILPRQLIVEEHDSFDDLRDTVMDALKKAKLKRYSEPHKVLVDAIIELIDSRGDYSREYITLFLMVRVKTDSQYFVKSHLDRLNIKLPITNINRINTILSVHALENGIHFTGAHDLKAIEQWQATALNNAVRNKKYVFESI